MRPLRWLAPIALTAPLFACAADPADGAEDPVDEVGIAGGKADGPFSECELGAVLDLVNDVTMDVAKLRGVGVSSSAARRIAAHRDGADAQPGTADDDPFDDIAELDLVPYVGTRTFRVLVDASADACVTRPSDAAVVFSPQPWETSHLAQVVTAIEATHDTIDVAMYSLGDARVVGALQNASARGVTIRMIFDGATTDRSSANLASTMTGRLEAAGIDVRWVNKVMHHKFGIFDGPRTTLDRASSAVLVTGSGNWSSSAGSRYDENTVVLRGHAEATLRFQQEFNRLWDGSREVGAPPASPISAIAISEADIPDDPAFDVALTSSNFDVHGSSLGPTWSVVAGRNTVSDRLVALIRGAQRSIHIASGHLRSRAIAEALIARHDEDPSLDIRVYLDDQEYLSESAHDAQVRDLQTCIDAAGGNAARVQDCNDRGFLWSYAAHHAGIALRYKFYAYRWDASYAKQMHDKYMIVDGRIVASGSYNYSDNAEHGTMENMVVYDAAGFPALVAAFEANFESVWATGEAQGLFDAFVQTLASHPARVPLVFEPMALSWDQVTELKRAIRAACPAADSAAYRGNAAAHQVCEP